MPPTADEQPIEAARPVVKSTRWRLSFVWIVPIVSALVALSLFVRHVDSVGRSIKVSFQSAEGLESGKTEVRYRDVPIGTVSDITVSEDLSHVIVSIALQRWANKFSRANTRFWVVRPRIGVGGVSGIGTLLSGAYIEADPGKADRGPLDRDQTGFTGLEVPPAITSESHGSQFNLHSTDLGSLDLGSPVYYRRLRVGKVVSYDLDKNGKGVSIGVFIDSPYDRLVTASTRFWNASGIDVSLGADGLKLRTQSLASVAAGGIAFITPSWAAGDTAPAQPGAQFELLKDEDVALQKPSGEPVYVWMQFSRSLRGLSVNAPVEFIGIEIGRVVSVTLDYDPVSQQLPIVVGAVIYPERIGNVFKYQPDDPEEEARRLGALMEKLVAHGLRAQARNGNLLTGQLYIAIDLLPNARKVSFDGDKRPLQIPTAPGALDNLQEQLSNIVAKVDKIPFDTIGNRLNSDLGDLDKTLNQLNEGILPESENTLKAARSALSDASGALSGDSPLRTDVKDTLDELKRSARSIRALSEFLSRHPEALIRGQPKDAIPQAPQNGASSTAEQPKP